MSKEEAVARALLLVTAKKPASPNGVDLNVLTLDPDFDDLPQDCTEGTEDDDITQEAVILLARAAIAAADKWDAEQQTLAAATDLLPRQHLDPDKWPSRSNISAGQDAAIQDELDHPPASIMEEGK